MNKFMIPWERQMPWYIRILGGKWIDDARSYRMSWGELTLGVNWRWALKLHNFEGDHYSLHVAFIFFNAFIYLPFRGTNEGSWGIACHDWYIKFSWGQHSKNFDVPWRSCKFVSHERLLVDGTWAVYRGHEYDPATKSLVKDEYHQEQHPFFYLLSNGKVQERIAIVCAERWTWQLRYFPWIKHIRYSMEVRFNDEVGDESGSWKGGVTGTGYELKSGETLGQCLRRMQKHWRTR